MSTHSFNRALVIVPCGRKKIWSIDPLAKSTSAKDAYVSNYFRLCRFYAERFADVWVILSGKYGIIAPDFVLDEDYDKKLSSSVEFESKVREQLRLVVSKGVTKVVSLCGNHYSQLLGNAFVHFGLTVCTPLQRLRIGMRQRQLRRCLERNVPL